MNIFVAASYSSKVNYETGEVLPEYRDWLESVLNILEGFGHTVFCALRADKYKIDSGDPAGAYNLDIKHLRKSDALIALVDDKASTGVQTEIGYALALDKMVVFAHEANYELSWFNKAIVHAGQAIECELPLAVDPFIEK